jgi:hypothetical protein
MMTVVMLPRSQKVERHIRPRWPSRCVRKTKARSKGQAPEEPAARRMPRAGPTEAAGPGSAIGSYFAAAGVFAFSPRDLSLADRSGLRCLHTLEGRFDVKENPSIQ